MPLILLIILAVVFSILSTILAAFKSNKKVLIVNGALYAVCALLVISTIAENAVTDKDSEKYYIQGGSLLNSLEYDRTENDCYIFLQTNFLSPPGEIAIPQSDARLPFITKFYKPVMIYSDSDDNVVKIRPNFLVLNFFAGLADIGLLIVFRACSHKIVCADFRA